MKPKVSIIMPVYNAEKYIKKTIDCILTQTYKDFELILIIDCPTDGTLSIISKIKDERIRIIKNASNRGISYSRNRGLEEAKGEYIALMDHDDLAPEDRIEIEVNYLDKHPEIDIVGGQLIKINENDEEITYPNHVSSNPKIVWAEFFFRDRISNGTAMIRTKFINENNIRYRDGLLGMEDYKFWTECSAKGAIVNLNEVLLYWRYSKDSETQRVFREQKKEREELFAKIQIEALEMQGFVLGEEEQKVFCKCFCENLKEYISLDDLRLAHAVLVKLIKQARKLHSDKAEEFEFVCRRRFGLKTENSEIWKEVKMI